MDQTCFGSRGFFWPMINPLFQGRWHRLIGRAAIRDPPPSHPPRRSIASELFIAAEQPSFPTEFLTGRYWREAVVVDVSLAPAKSTWPERLPLDGLD
jgi:hypothetical protein